MKLVFDDAVEPGEGVVLTDPAPALDTRGRLCPQCGAKPEARTWSDNFGRSRWPVCKSCGYEFPELKEERRGVL